MFYMVYGSFFFGMAVKYAVVYLLKYVLKITVIKYIRLYNFLFLAVFLMCPVVVSHGRAKASVLYSKNLY